MARRLTKTERAAKVVHPKIADRSERAAATRRATSKVPRKATAVDFVELMRSGK